MGRKLTFSLVGGAVVAGFIAYFLVFKPEGDERHSCQLDVALRSLHQDVRLGSVIELVPRPAAVEDSSSDNPFTIIRKAYRPGDCIVEFTTIKDGLPLYGASGLLLVRQGKVVETVVTTWR